MSGPAAFSLEHLSVGYDGMPLIRDICACVEKGQILTLIGPNGAGKSTILKTITQHLSRLGGVVRIGGEDVRSMSSQLLARQLAVVLTERIRPELMTCYDVVASGRYPYTGRFGALTARDREIVAQSLALVHGEELADRPFGRTSDGQRQRIMLARALCQEPEVLVLDEPTSFLDIRYKIELSDILLRLAREKGVTIVMSLHEIDLASRVSDLVMCVKGDSVDNVGTPDQVFTEKNITALYGMESGGYDPLSGGMELPRVQGAPRVFVLGGMGKATPVYRQMQRRQIPFATGILFENDADCPAARHLASRAFITEAFLPAEQALVSAAIETLTRCELLIDPGVPTHGMNACCESLLEAARERSMPIERKSP